MVQNESEMLKVELAQGAGQLFGQRIAHRIRVTDPFALYDFNRLLTDRLHRKRIDFNRCDDSSPAAFIHSSRILPYDSS